MDHRCSWWGRRTVGSGRRAYEAAIARALDTGGRILSRGGSAVRAVAAAVAILEDEALFNAGRGAVLCRDGSVELSASIMNGHSRAVGAVVGVKRTKNPALAARALMSHSHCLLFGSHGDEFAATRGLDQVSPDYFVTPQRRRQWERASDRSKLHLDHAEDAQGTVGAVARDRRGKLAAATSTGGLLNQLPGRVGDSPVVGAGTWADRRCAISATGKGDAFFRVAFSRRVADLIELGSLRPEEAIESALADVASVKGEGGCILVSPIGSPLSSFNTPHMVRGWLEKGG